MREDSDELSDFRGHKRENFVPNLENQSGLGQGAEGTEGKTEFGQYFRQRQYLPPLAELQRDMVK